MADDFIVPVGKEMDIKQITIEVLSQSQVTDATINIRANNGGAPGAVIRTVTRAPSSGAVTPYTNAFGFNVYHLTFNILPSDGWLPLSTGIYWLEPTMINTGGTTVFWRTTTNSYGALIQNSGNSGNTWSENEDGYNAIFFVAGDCDDVPFDPCGQGNTSNDFENGYQIGNGNIPENADVFYVPAGETLELKTIELSIGAVTGPLESISFNFYNNAVGDRPGTIHTSAATVGTLYPYASVYQADYFDMDWYKIYVELDSPITFNGGASGNYYWMQPKAVAYQQPLDGGVFWETTSLGTLGISSYGRNSPSSNWTVNSGENMVFTLHCDVPDLPCTPYTDNPGFLYINDLSFLGTLNDVSNLGSGYSTGAEGGYQDWTGLDQAIQAQDEGINISFKAVNRGQVRAWVDWNDDGVFDRDEMVFDSDNIGTSATIFGFVIPSTQPPGDYTMRIRIYTIRDYGLSYPYEDWWQNFTPCMEFKNGPGGWIDHYGEAEDYKFTVIPKCDVRITDVYDGEVCTNTSGKAELDAAGSGGLTQLRWYTSEYGGSPIGTSIPGTPWETPTINTTETYWVTGWNGSCESTRRVPVVAMVSPVPDIDFVQQDPEICGETEASVNLEAFGDKQQYFLIDENFDAVGLGVFSNVRGPGHTNADADWRKHTSTFIPPKPPYQVFFPALASGLSGDGFVSSIADVGMYSNTDRSLVLTNSVNSNDLENMTLRFKLFFYSFSGGTAPNSEYLNVDISTNGGSNWTNVHKYTNTVGIPNKPSIEEIILDAYVDEPNLKIRFRMFSQGFNEPDNQGWMSTAALLDDIQLFGDKPLDTPLNWQLAGGNIGFYEPDCTTPLTSATTEICIKADETQIENEPLFKIEALATLSNGCTALGVIEVANMTKVWNPDSGGDNWATNGDWKPVPATGQSSNIPPDEDHCIIIKKPVNLNTGTDGLGKNLILKSAGKINIKNNASLTITDFILSDADADDFVVESDGNLIQINDITDPISDAPIRAEREVLGINNDIQNKMDYIYWSSPVDGQDIYSFSPGTPTGPQHWAFLEYNESNDYFDNTTDGDFISGKGYAIRAEDGKPNPYDETYAFRGPLHNEVVPRQITKTGQGFNLVGNPYPSNIDVEQLFFNNSDLIYQTAWFWTNNVDYQAYQQGGGYSGNNYAVYNLTGGNPATDTGTAVDIPDHVAKVGQGFLVQAKTQGSLEFKNNIRIKDAGEFYSKEIKDRFWLTLHTPSDILNTTLIGYIEGATNGYEPDYDAEFWGASDAIYSLIPDRELIIQGREYPLDINDVIPLGVKFHNDGVHVIRLEDPQGEFENIRVYLIDKELNHRHNLNKEAYKFFTLKGKYHDRFEIRYRKLGFGTSADPNLVTAATQKEDIIILSTLENIREVQLFDVLGMEVYQNVKVNGKELRITAGKWMNSILFARIITEDGDVTTTKVLLKQ